MKKNNKKRKKLWFVTCSDINEGAGRSIGIKSRIKEMSKHLDIILITHEKVTNPGIVPYIKENRVHGKRLYLPHLKKPQYWPQILSLYRRLDKLIDEESPILYTDTSYIALYKRYAKKKRKMRLIYNASGMDTERLIAKKAFKRNSMAHKVFSKYEKRCFQQADRIITVTKKIKDIIVERYKIPDSNIYVISNGVDPGMFSPDVKGEHILKELGWERNKIVFWLGNFKPWQGLGYLISAAPEILEKLPDTRFMIVGGGDGEKELRERAKRLGIDDKVAFIGKVEHSDVPVYISTADVCIAYFSIRGKESTDLSPLKLYEYLSCGKPVVGCNIGGVGDFLECYNCGLGVEPGKPGLLAEAVVKLLTNDKLRSEMGRNGRDIIEKEFS